MISDIFVAISSLACVAGTRRGKGRGLRKRHEKRAQGMRGGVLPSEFAGFPKLHPHGPPTCAAYWHDNIFSDDLRQIHLEVRVLRITESDRKN